MVGRTSRTPTAAARCSPVAPTYPRGAPPTNRLPQLQRLLRLRIGLLFERHTLQGDAAAGAGVVDDLVAFDDAGRLAAGVVLPGLGPADYVELFSLFVEDGAVALGAHLLGVDADVALEDAALVLHVGLQRVALHVEDLLAGAR